MNEYLRVPLLIILGACLAAAGACGPGSTSTPAEPAATAPAEPPAQAAPATGAPQDATAAAAPAGESEGREGAGADTYIPPVRGTAEIAYVTPKTVVKNNVVITTITVRNLSTGSIAGLKIEEYWWDKASNPVTGDSVRLTKPLLPGETTTVTLETPRDPKMFRNTYVFRHAFGQIKATLQKSLE